MRRSFRGGKQQIQTAIKELKINERILAPEVMVIDENGQNIGVISKFEAVEIAKSKDLDLVEVSPLVDPPICKIMNYGSYKYQKEKQERKHKAKQKVSELKTIKVSSRISNHDLDLRVDQSVKFLTDGNKVRIELQLKGREHQHVDLAKEIINKIITRVKEKLAGKEMKVEQDIKKLGSKLSAIITL
ncbi:MAG: translation initiation factor IF-3 [Candidatus Buchananbacteria bacterium]|nr:translation initiation factor IF-3 [Candidatus Buchananbacteria bacterium]